ncbi:MAG TPA: hypothetical protein VI479_21510, partial [Blastocatellia bacterium]
IGRLLPHGPPDRSEGPWQTKQPGELNPDTIDLLSLTLSEIVPAAAALLVPARAGYTAGDLRFRRRLSGE